jgi:hypothetical protein
MQWTAHVLELSLAVKVSCLIDRLWIHTQHRVQRWAVAIYGVDPRK